jgi:hypothetical protein
MLHMRKEWRTAWGNGKALPKKYLITPKRVRDRTILICVRAAKTAIALILSAVERLIVFNLDLKCYWMKLFPRRILGYLIWKGAWILERARSRIMDRKYHHGLPFLFCYKGKRVTYYLISKSEGALAAKWGVYCMDQRQLICRWTTPVSSSFFQFCYFLSWVSRLYSFSSTRMPLNYWNKQGKRNKLNIERLQFWRKKIDKIKETPKIRSDP